MIGEDFSIGYQTHTDATVKLFIRKSFTLRTLSDEAAVPLRYASAPADC